MTPSARKRLPQREHRTPRRPRPEPGPERPQPMMIAATPSPTNWPLGSRGTQPIAAIFDGAAPIEFSRRVGVPRWTAECSMVEGWPTIEPSLGPPRCNSDEPERSHRTRRREKESRETGHFFPGFELLGLARIPLRFLLTFKIFEACTDFLTPDELGSCRKHRNFGAYRSLMQSYGCGSAALGPLWLIVF